jgi:hypothetical protein
MDNYRISESSRHPKRELRLSWPPLPDNSPLKVRSRTFDEFAGFFDGLLRRRRA